MTATPAAQHTPTDRIDRSPLPAAEPPKPPSAARWLGGVTAIALAALGVAALRDAAVAAGWLPGPTWTVQALDLVDGLGPSRWQLVAGPIACLLGIGFIVAAIPSRRRRWYTLQTGQGIYLRPADVARLASVTAQDVDGVTQASSVSGRQRLTVRIECTAPQETAADIAHAVQVAVDERLSVLRPTPRTRVQLTHGRSAR